MNYHEEVTYKIQLSNTNFQWKDAVMINCRRHYFPANDSYVITGLLPTGEYGAYRENEDEGRIRGYGHSRLAAIADMVEQIADDLV